MKIKLFKKHSTKQGQTIVIQKQREGCFLQALNCGCIVIVFILIGIGLAVVWGPHLGK